MAQQNNKFSGIDHHSVIIRDIEKSRHFYADILGLEEDLSRPQMSFDGLWFIVGEQAIHCLCLKNPDSIRNTELSWFVKTTSLLKHVSVRESQKGYWIGPLWLLTRAA